MLLTYKENVHSTQMYIPLKPLFSRHKGIGVQFTDEPTGNLDDASSKVVEDIFDMLHREMKKTIILVTHDLDFANKSEKKYSIRNGRLVRQ